MAAKLGYASPNTEFRKGHAEALRLDGSVDVVIDLRDQPGTGQGQRLPRRCTGDPPGGRFTIWHIVADQRVPNYLVHDTQKWGDCLSGALHSADYLGGLVGRLGFLGVHQVLPMAGP